MAHWRIKATLDFAWNHPLTAFRKPPEGQRSYQRSFSGAGPFLWLGQNPRSYHRCYHRCLAGFSAGFSWQGFSGFHSGFSWAGPFCQKSGKTPGVICAVFVYFAEARVLPVPRSCRNRQRSVSPRPYPPCKGFGGFPWASPFLSDFRTQRGGKPKVFLCRGLQVRYKVLQGLQGAAH